MYALLDGWMILPPMDEFAALLRGEQACFVELNEDLDVFERFFEPPYAEKLGGRKWPIRRHDVYSLADFLELCRAYRSLAARHRRSGVKCFFRGQFREYLNAAGSINVSPASWRADVPNCYRGSYSSELNKLLRPWDGVLEGLGVSVETGARAVDTSKVSSRTVYFAEDNSAFARILTNAYLLSTVMHYGFPTSALDVTPKPLVALWFALHRAMRDGENRIFFESVEKDSPDADPTVYVYIQTDEDQCPIVELGKIRELREVMLRPFRQSASALLFDLLWMEHRPGEWFPGQPRFANRTETKLRWPSAVIRVHFGAEELASSQPELTSDFLFPKEDLLYQRLLEAKAPELCVFA
jgi:hypothetical protein